jgi:hypothetical protein
MLRHFSGHRMSSKTSSVNTWQKGTPEQSCGMTEQDETCIPQTSPPIAAACHGHLLQHLMRTNGSIQGQGNPPKISLKIPNLITECFASGTCKNDCQPLGFPNHIQGSYNPCSSQFLLHDLEPIKKKERMKDKLLWVGTPQWPSDTHRVSTLHFFIGAEELLIVAPTWLLHSPPRKQF